MVRMTKKRRQESNPRQPAPRTTAAQRSSRGSTIDRRSTNGSSVSSTSKHCALDRLSIQSWPQSSVTIFAEGRPLWVPRLSIFLTTSEPSATSPKTTCLPSSQLVITVVIKN